MEKSSVTALVMATMIEAKPFILGMALEKCEGRPFPLFKKDNTCLVISGIGKANAAMATAYCCQIFDPICICNLGAAGAADANHTLGEIFHINKVLENDRPELMSGRTRIHTPHVFDDFPAATLSTSDRPILDPEEREEISKNADLIDMEGASVVQACKIFKRKCYIFKFVSDTPEHTNGKDILKSIRLYRTPFYDFFLKSVMPAISRLTIP